MGRSMGKAMSKIEGYCNSHNIDCKKARGRQYRWGPRKLRVQMILSHPKTGWSTRQLLVDTKFLKSRVSSNSLKVIIDWGRKQDMVGVSKFALSDIGPF